MPDGFLNVLKPPGMSSHDIVSFIRRVYGLKKVGHAGTLDPAAAGVLPVAVGKATRMIEYLADADKAYRAELTLGYETDTGDDTGHVVRTAAFSMPDRAAIEEVLASFRGEQWQTPPQYAAIKIDGQKLCDLARKGIAVEVPARRITLYSLSLVNCGNGTVLYDAECSKGTYIRSLCMDIGRRLGIPAVMSFLVRTRVGGFTLSSSRTLEEISAEPETAVCSMDSVLSHLSACVLEPGQANAFCQGKKLAIALPDVSDCVLRVYNSDQTFIGIGGYESLRARLVPVKVVTGPA